MSKPSHVWVVQCFGFPSPVTVRRYRFVREAANDSGVVVFDRGRRTTIYTSPTRTFCYTADDAHARYMEILAEHLSRACALVEKVRQLQAAPVPVEHVPEGAPTPFKGKLILE